ncbi:dienelactone hydrolase family protein [Mycobacterium avium]|uniref:dienelactone hydrolase family protein n=1 Tax=Mycobacterium avium TaxID=1764 RepID=UPI001CC466C4|nr:dienelactone hydrolase family protein [Mycobacterium avium]MBZ4521856.1 dienelactone hydrolase family protein [Mycobacterium avium subsp. hominissuis]MBZ4531239.1 dienelactone hydrolase family protein [Mycobacterium avium subsp. hominissuis]
MSRAEGVDRVSTEVVLADGVRAWMYCPPGAASGLPALVIGAEATGVNAFIHDTARKLADIGFVTVVPDYYRGAGPSDPEDYSNIADIMRNVDALDFPRATEDLMLSFQYLVEHPRVDPDRIGVWGYCTGATLAWLTASLRRDAALAVLFYPSQPVFDEHSLERPVSPIDLLWNLRCPTYFVYGTLDPVMPVELRNELRNRLRHWRIEYELRLYKDCGHSFGAPVPGGQNSAAYQAAWEEAVSYAATKLRAGQPRHQEGN